MVSAGGNPAINLNNFVFRAIINPKQISKINLKITGE